MQKHFPIIPKGVEWIHDRVESISAKENSIKCSRGVFTYDDLVIATGPHGMLKGRM